MGVASISSTTTSSAVSTIAASASAPFTNALRYARCMREHGEVDFPDPSDPGGFSTTALARLDAASRQFIAADTTCLRLLPNAGQPTPVELAQTIVEGLRFARCMRARGIPFPDPGISGTDLTLDLGAVDTNSPQYATAAQACRTQPGS